MSWQRRPINRPGAAGTGPIRINFIAYSSVVSQVEWVHQSVSRPRRRRRRRLGLLDFFFGRLFLLLLLFFIGTRRAKRSS